MNCQFQHPRPQIRTIPDPELPADSGEVLYFVMLEMDFANIQEVARVTQLEMKGGIDKDGLKEFVKARAIKVSTVESMALESVSN